MFDDLPPNTQSNVTYTSTLLHLEIILFGNG